MVFGHVRLLLIEDYATANHDPLTAVLYSLTSLGSEAVIVFFVLSGYWVGGSVISGMRARTFSWARYANARLTRLWLVLIPALLLTVLVDAVGASLLGTADVYARPDLYTGIPADPSYSPLTFLGNVVFLQDLHVPIFGTNQPLWSLAYEFWYYLLFPALLVAFWPGGSARRRAVGVLLAVLAVVVSGPVVMGLFPAWVLGAVVAALRGRISGVLRAMPGGLLVLARLTALPLIVGAAVAAHEVEMPFRGGALLLAIVTAISMSVFVVDVSWIGCPGRLLDAASWTAHSSYSLYATHMPLVVLAAALMIPSVGDRWAVSVPSALVFIGLIVACCLVAYVFARYTERKTDVVRKWITRQPRRPAELASATAVENGPTRR
ncbi:Acyltransferase family protein [Clavibacter michiganensis]|uniref:Acyltransferase family protein n=1 Tax=Clavibacter michiganensis TaxID=28447 RepID=A0A251YTV2_9MICO|nr:Acyltransferase family protein [Clavibacter michiganensis]